VRGWERHQSRLALRIEPEPGRETLDSVSARESGQDLREVRYWTEHRLERIEFVKRVLQELDRNHWPNRTDLGWSEYDVEIYGNRWSNVHFITVVEDHPRHRQLIRCRLQGRWSAQAHIVFWTVLALEILFVGSVCRSFQWSAVLLLTMPLLVYFLHRQKRAVQSLLVVLLDALAKEMGLIKIPAETAPPPPPASPTTPK
jgi:hypothetical protein